MTHTDTAATFRDRVTSRAEELKMSLEAVSRAAGLDKTYLRKTLGRGGVPKFDTLEKLADVLQCQGDWLLGTGDALAPAPADLEQTDRARMTAIPLPGVSPPKSGPVTASDVRPADVELPSRATLPTDVPVYGTAAGSHARGAFQFEGGVVDYVRRPPGLLGSRAVYALYIEGTSMTPEHNPGDLRFVHTTKPARAGDSVIVQIRNVSEDRTEGVIGHYLKTTPTMLVIGKLNPAASIEINREYVVSVHKVLTVNEMFGV